MRKVSFASLISLFILIILISACKSAEKSKGVLLRFDLQNGKGYEYEMVWDMDQKIMGAKLENKLPGALQSPGDI